MIYVYSCEDCGDIFEVRATLAEKERGLSPRCPECSSENVEQEFTNVGILTNSAGGGPFCGPGPRTGCC